MRFGADGRVRRTCRVPGVSLWDRSWGTPGIAVPKTTPFVITEGNYLLADQQPWHRIREYLDEIWLVETPRDVRISRLIERHIAFGKDQDAAFAWAYGPDEANAHYIDSKKHRADRVIDWG